MADQIVTNEVPSTTNQWFAVFRLVEEMIAAGWTVVEMSDGTTVTNTDNWTGSFGSLGADSWIILQANSGQQILFKRDGSDNKNGWIAWSRDGNFTTGGTSTAPANIPSDAAGSSFSTARGTVTPGTPGSFSGNQSWLGSNATTFDRLNIGVRDASGVGDESFWIILKQNGSGYQAGNVGRLAFEKLEHESGLGISDPYPYAWFVPDNENGNWGPKLNDINCVFDDDQSAGRFRRWWPGRTARGTIDVVAQANLVDGETFVLDDGTNPAVTFEYDVAGDGVGGGNVQINVSGDTTADEVRDTTITAINGAGSLNISAANGGAGRVRVYNDNVGTAGNQTITESVADAGFTVSGMSGGMDEDYRRYGTGALAMNNGSTGWDDASFETDRDRILFQADQPIILHALHLVKHIESSGTFKDPEGGWTTNIAVTDFHGANLDTFGNGAWAKFGDFMVVWWDGDQTNPPLE